MTEQTDTASVVKSGLTADDYASIESFQDALALVGDKLGGVVIDSADLGDGFAVVEEKDTLLGVPFIVLAVNIGNGDHGEFVSCRIVTEDGRKLVVNDGSTGIYAQIKMLWEKRPETKGKPIICRNGLRKSEYDHPEHGHAKTYYLDTSGKSK